MRTRDSYVTYTLAVSICPSKCHGNIAHLPVLNVPKKAHCAPCFCNNWWISVLMWVVFVVTCIVREKCNLTG